MPLLASVAAICIKFVSPYISSEISRFEPWPKEFRDNVVKGCKDFPETSDFACKCYVENLENSHIVKLRKPRRISESTWLQEIGQEVTAFLSTPDGKEILNKCFQTDQTKTANSDPIRPAIEVNRNDSSLVGKEFEEQSEGSIAMKSIDAALASVDSPSKNAMESCVINTVGDECAKLSVSEWKNRNFEESVILMDRACKSRVRIWYCIICIDMDIYSHIYQNKADIETSKSCQKIGESLAASGAKLPKNAIEADALSFQKHRIAFIDSEGSNELELAEALKYGCKINTPTTCKELSNFWKDKLAVQPGREFFNKYRKNALNQLETSCIADDLESCKLLFEITNEAKWSKLIAKIIAKNCDLGNREACSQVLQISH